MKNVVISKTVSTSEPVIYSGKDLQKILGCGEKFAYRLMRSNCFPSIKINSKYIITQQKFNEWLDKNSSKKITI